MGDDVRQGDRVCVDGKDVARKAEHEYYLLNKPKGYVCTVKDDKDRKTVMQLLPENAGRVYPVGRLDYEGELAVVMKRCAKDVSADDALDYVLKPISYFALSQRLDRALERGYDSGGRVTLPITDEEAYARYYLACLREEKGRYEEVFRRMEG